MKNFIRDERPQDGAENFNREDSSSASSDNNLSQFKRDKRVRTRQVEKVERTPSSQRMNSDRPAYDRFNSDRPSVDRPRQERDFNNERAYNRRYDENDQQSPRRSNYNNSSSGERTRSSFNPNFTRDNRPRNDYNQSSDRPRRFQPQGERDFNRTPNSGSSYGGGRPQGDRPRYNNDRPRYNNSDDKPRYNNDRPRYSSDDKPRYNNDRPRYNNDRPNYNNDRPRYNNSDDKPRYNNDRPSYNSDRPRYNNDRNRTGGGSSYGEGRPRFGGDRQQGGQRPQYRNNNNGRPNNGGYNRRNDDGRGRFTHQPEYDINNYPQFPAPKFESEIRLNRYIATSGLCSRREADEYIKEGLITVNGTVVTELGSKVQPNDEVRYNGEVIQSEKKVYIVMNKPKGYVTTLEDQNAEKTVMDLLKNACKERVYPVGRLDKNSLGVLLFTNDGDLTTKLTHPSYNKKKVYQVALDKPVTRADMERMATGIELEDGEIYADEIAYIGESKRDVGVEIHSGRNRIVRRMFEHCGYKVQKLDRVYFAGLTKKNLKRGAWRFLTPKEVAMLKSGEYE